MRLSFARPKISTIPLRGYKYQPRAPASNTSKLATAPVPLHFSALANSIAVFFPLFKGPIDLMAGEDNRGKRVVEEVLKANLPMS